MSTNFIRSTIFALVAIFLSQNTVSAQELSWAQKMFEKKIFEQPRLDLGVVARGADFNYYIKVKNIYKEDVHVVDVKTSCGCTDAKIDKDLLKTYDTGLIKISLNTRKFMRRKDTKITVVFDQPLYTEVEIPMTFYIRSDVVLTPGGVDFGTLEKGEAREKTIDLAYSGRSNWQIKDIKNRNPNIDVQFKEVSRVGRNVNYKLHFSLKPEAPAGAINQQITLVTDDASNPYVPVLVRGNVESDIEITPVVQNLGKLGVGKEKKFRVVLKGKKPFAVTNIECESATECFKVKLPENKKPVFVVPFSFTAPEKPGKFSEEFTITIEGRDEPIKFKAVGEIVSTPS